MLTPSNSLAPVSHSRMRVFHGNLVTRALVRVVRR
jgi:hypothetical protein